MFILAQLTSIYSLSNRNVRFCIIIIPTGIIIILWYFKLNNMSQELIDFSEQIDEQFDIADMQSVESDDLLEAIVNLFI